MFCILIYTSCIYTCTSIGCLSSSPRYPLKKAFACVTQAAAVYDFEASYTNMVGSFRVWVGESNEEKKNKLFHENPEEVYCDAQCGCAINFSPRISKYKLSGSFTQFGAYWLGLPHLVEFV